MKKWLVYLLGVITGVILTFAFVFCINLSNDPGIIGPELFEEPGDYMEYSQFEVFQVIESGCALAHAYDSFGTVVHVVSDILNPKLTHAGDSFGTIVLIIPNENKRFYDGKKITLESDQCAQHVGTYKYSTKEGIKKTVPVVRIIDGVELPKSNKVGR